MQTDYSKVSYWLQAIRKISHAKLFLLDVTVLGVVVGLFLFRVPLEKWGESAELTEQPTFAQEEKGRWNFPLRQLRLEEYSLKRGDALATILQQKGFSPQEISLIVESARGVFSMHSLRTGKPLYLIYRKRRDNGKPLYAVYEPSPYEYIVFHLYDQPCVEVIKRDIKVETRVAAGEVQSNLWHALVESGLKDDLADAMIDALAVSVDFYRQKIGDRFKVLYEQDMVEGQPVGSGKILVAVYEREGKSYYAFRFSPSEGKTEYYDYDGRPARKAFLKAPVKYSRISSRFSMNRLHPILGYRRPHFGTDYAAPYGTPILAVADGVVTEATQRGGNGKYVRIRHDKVYETQYLHMSSFARGIRPGVRVVQGQVIGYVGATGLATGPHVCFRFWKNGQQVDHLRLNLPQPEPISGQLWEAFKARRDSLLEQLKRIEYPRTSAEKKPNTAP